MLHDNNISSNISKVRRHIIHHFIIFEKRPTLENRCLAKLTAKWNVWDNESLVERDGIGRSTDSCGGDVVCRWTIRWIVHWLPSLAIYTSTITQWRSWQHHASTTRKWILIRRRNTSNICSFSLSLSLSLSLSFCDMEIRRFSLSFLWSLLFYLELERVLSFLQSTIKFTL